MKIDSKHLLKLAEKWEQNEPKIRNGNATTEELAEYAKQDGEQIGLRKAAESLRQLLQCHANIKKITDK